MNNDPQSIVLRKASGVEPVKLGQYPKWLHRRVCFGLYGKMIGQGESLNLLSSFMGTGNLDHWGTSFGKRVFVSEPYMPYNDDTFGHMALVAEWLGVEFKILKPDQSSWYPGRTIRIEFFQCPHNPACRKCTGDAFIQLASVKLRKTHHYPFLRSIENPYVSRLEVMGCI